MPTLFSHGFSAWVFSRFLPKASKTLPLIWAGVVCAILPDADVLAFKFGIPYSHVLGHRGITHSIFFSVVLAYGVTALFFGNAWLTTIRSRRIFLFLFMCTLSHAILDAMTTGGLGVAFFAPFDATRYFLPWRFIRVSPIGIESFISTWGYRVLVNEFKMIWIPGLLLSGAWMVFRQANSFFRRRNE